MTAERAAITGCGEFQKNTLAPVYPANSWMMAASRFKSALPQEIEPYVEAWSQPGAAAAMINYYRASVPQTDHDEVPNLDLASSACPTRRTVCITTKLNASTNC